MWNTESMKMLQFYGNIVEMAAHAQAVNTRLFLSFQVLATNLAKWASTSTPKDDRSSSLE